MFCFLAAPQQQWQTSEFLPYHGDAPGRHRHVPAASVRFDDHASGDAAPGRSFVSVIEPAAGEVRYRYLVRSAYLDEV